MNEISILSDLSLGGGGTLTISLLLPDNVLALPVQELQVVRHHPLLAFVNDFGVGAGVQVLPTSHFLVFQPCQNLVEGNSWLGCTQESSQHKMMIRRNVQTRKDGKCNADTFEPISNGRYSLLESAFIFVVRSINEKAGNSLCGSCAQRHEPTD